MASSGPGAALRRSWRRLRRRPAGVQVVALVVVIAVVGGAVYGITAASSKKTASGPPGSSGTSAPTGTTGSQSGLGLGNPSGVGVDQASTSTRGVTATSINVVFPVSNLTSLASNFGFAGDTEFGAQKAAIHTFVNAINDAGGINGRKINAMIVNFDPTNESGMRALCKQWTEGSPPVFAVLDGLGSWTGDNELCITQEGHTPFIGQWTTVTNWTQEGAPYLWWTGPDQAQILATVVSWGKSSGLLDNSHRVGIVAGDRTSDQVALNQYLLPDLRHGRDHEPARRDPAVQPRRHRRHRLRPLPWSSSASRRPGVKSVIPLIPFNSFFPFLSQENGQNYYPKLLLSDYESSIETTLGLIPIPYEKGLDHQEGVTVETLGGTDAPIPQSEGGYNPAVNSCYDTWKAHNKPTSTVSPYIEEQGPIVGVVPGHPAVRRRGPRGGPGPRPAHLRAVDVEDPELPRAPTPRH